MKHWHFVGVSGVGMSAMARAALAEGYRVSGCDLASSALAAILVGWPGHLI